MRMVPCETFYARQHIEAKRCGRNAEAAPGFEPGMEVLQTSALPLGYAAITKKAGDRIRTGDPNLGKVVLYQLSYTRINRGRDYSKFG